MENSGDKLSRTEILRELGDTNIRFYESIKELPLEHRKRLWEIHCMFGNLISKIDRDIHGPLPFAIRRRVIEEDQISVDFDFTEFFISAKNLTLDKKSQ